MTAGGLRACANRSWSASWSGVPSVEGPGASEQSADEDDGVGEGDVEVGDDLAAFGAAGEFVEGVVPRVGAFDRPAFGGLDRGWDAFAGDPSAQ